MPNKLSIGVMNIFMFFSKWHSKKTVKKFIKILKNIDADARAEQIFYVWLTRGINLALADEKTFSNTQNMLKENGFGTLNIPIYIYEKGSEVGIINYKKVCGVRNQAYLNALSIHLYTSLAATYSERKEYCYYVKEMWKLLLSNYGDLEKMKLEFSTWFENPVEVIKTVIENNNITVKKLIEEPDIIYPEFLKQK